MPQLHSDSSVAAASLLLHILSGSAAPAQLLQSAVATLHQLPLTPESGSQPSLPQIQLACELLQLFTPEAFQALPAPKGNGKAAKGAGSLATEGFGVLLQLVRVGIDEHLVESQELVKLREAAFRRLDADVYAVMPVQQQMQAFLVSCGGVLLPITDRVTCLKKGLSAYNVLVLQNVHRASVLVVVKQQNEAASGEASSCVGIIAFLLKCQRLCNRLQINVLPLQPRTCKLPRSVLRCALCIPASDDTVSSVSPSSLNSFVCDVGVAQWVIKGP